MLAGSSGGRGVRRTPDKITVTLLRSEPGESRFTCGLGMLQRRLVVE